MSDSDKTNEIDNYGVWVKKPPRTVSSEMDSLDTDLDLSSDLPDFSDIDIIDETPFDTDDKALSADELSALAVNTEITAEEGFEVPAEESVFEESATEDAPVDPNAMEEISLDDFIEGGIFEGDDGGSAASEASEAAAKANTEETVDASDFLSESSSFESTEPSVSEPASFDDGPLDIQLSFDDEPAASTGTEETTFETIDSFDTASFDSPAAASDDGTESVDLSEFGLDFDSPSPEAPAEESTPSVGADGMEEISLDDFGFDINAEESKPEDESPAAEESAPAEDDNISFDEPAAPVADTADTIETPAEEFSSEIEDISLDSFGLDDSSDEGISPELELPKSDGIEMSVAADDDMEAPAEEPAQEAPATETVDADDDFDLDSIMNSIEDENGNTTSLNFEEPEQTPEEALAIAETDIPDTFDEETESLFGDDPVEDPMDSLIEDAAEESSLASEIEADSISEEIVENSGPVFEETSVNLSEIPDAFEDTPAASEEVAFADEPTLNDDSNPFTLPPDDAFVNEAVIEEPVIEEAATEEEVVQEPVAEEPAIEETFAETATEPVQSEPAAAQEEITAGKDAEIASATNTILSQIVAELASLKNEISGLKNDFAELKSQEQENSFASISVEEEKDEGGFFTDDGEDDTIALSIDELDNILNTVEIVDEPQGEAAETESAEDSVFVGNELEEPVLNDTADTAADFGFESEPTEEADEILIPKVEDTIVEEPALDDTATTETVIEEPALNETAEPEMTAESEATEEDLSIGDFSFDDDANEIQPAAELSDEMMETIGVSEAEITESPDIFEESATETTEDPMVEASESEEELVLDDTLPDIVEETTPESSLDEPFEFGSDTISESEVSDTIADDAEVQAEEEAAEEDGISITNTELDRLLAEDASINDSLTDANLNYLSEDKNINADQTNSASSIPGNLQKEIKSVLSYMDQLLENLPEDKIAEFAQSEQFETYKKLFKELGLD
ncbi:MAG: hypothetical protein KBT11_11660 [Treponema sp.]|nr:hypothetical protein [Candidatus Treponema equifaecale]